MVREVQMARFIIRIPRSTHRANWFIVPHLFGGLERFNSSRERLKTVWIQEVDGRIANKCVEVDLS